MKSSTPHIARNYGKPSPDKGPRSPEELVALDDILRVQDNVAELTNAISDKPHMDSFLLEGLEIVLGKNDIKHKLGRKIRGWWIARDEHDSASFNAYLSADQASAANGAFVEFDATQHDTGSDFDTTGNSFTAPVTGLYRFEWAVELETPADTDGYISALTKNGSIIAYGSGGAMGAAASNTSVGSVVLSLEKDDVIKAITGHSGGPHTIGGSSSGTETYISGNLLSAISELTSSDENKILSLHSECARNLSLVVF